MILDESVKKIKSLESNVAHLTFQNNSLRTRLKLENQQKSASKQKNEQLAKEQMQQMLNIRHYIHTLQAQIQRLKHGNTLSYADDDKYICSNYYSQEAEEVSMKYQEDEKSVDEDDTDMTDIFDDDEFEEIVISEVLRENDKCKALEKNKRRILLSRFYK